MKLENKSKKFNKETGKEEKMPQDVNIDGEDLLFTNYIKYECLHEELEIIVDFERMVTKFYKI